MVAKSGARNGARKSESRIGPPLSSNGIRPFSVWVALAVDERDAVDAIKSAAGLAVDADVIRLALWRLAEHYQLQLPLATFAIGALDRRRLLSRALVKAKQRGAKSNG